MTPFTVLAALALSTFAPTAPARTASEPSTPKADATTAKPTTAPPGTPGASPTSPSREFTAPERAPAGMENYALLARCQIACDESNTSANKERASCKIKCLKTFPATPRKYEFVPSPSRTTPTNPKREVTTPEASPPTTPPGATPTNPKRQVTTPETSPTAPTTNPRRQTPPS